MLELRDDYGQLIVNRFIETYQFDEKGRLIDSDVVKVVSDRGLAPAPPAGDGCVPHTPSREDRTWISLEHECPEFNEENLFYSVSLDRMVVAFLDSFGMVSETMGSCWDSSCFDYWMPLPPKPEEGAGEQS